MKKRRILAAGLLLACALSGCAENGKTSGADSSVSVPGSTSTAADTGASSSAPSPLPEESGSEATASASTGGESAGAALPAAIDEEAVTAYVQDLGHFFQAPVADSREIPTDYSLAFFLVYETFTRNGGAEHYTQNEDYFWELPEADLLQTAADCLGLTELSLSDLTEWPFGPPQDGVCYYSQESSLPYSDLTVAGVEYDGTTGEAAVTATLSDSEFEDSSQRTTTLVYHLACTQRADGTVQYTLQSISAPA